MDLVDTINVTYAIKTGQVVKRSKGAVRGKLRNAEQDGKIEGYTTLTVLSGFGYRGISDSVRNERIACCDFREGGRTSGS